MKSDNLLNKFFIAQMILLNGVVLALIIKELVSFSKISSNLNELNQNELLLGEISKLPEPTLINNKYNNLISSVSKENSLANLLDFIESSSRKYQLQILNTKILEASNEEIRYQVEVGGDMENLANFIKNIEENTSMMEVVNSEINFISNSPNIKIVIKVTKI